MKHSIVSQLRCFIIAEDAETSAILKKVLEMKISNNFRKRINKHLQKLKSTNHAS